MPDPEPDVANDRDQRYRAIFESAVDFAIIAMDRDGQVTDWNPGAERILGWSAEEIQGAPLDCIFTPEDRAADIPRTEMQRALDAGRASDERWHLRKDGTRFWASGEMHPLRSAGGTHLGFLKILRDRTAQKQAEEELHASAATLSAVLDALPVGLAIVDAKGRVIRENAAHHALWGVTPETASWEQYGEWIGYWPETGQRIRAEEWAMARALHTGEVIRGELVECQPFGGGERRFFLNNAALIRDATGNIIGGMAVEQDVTQARRADLALKQSEQRLSDLLATLDLATVFVRHIDGTIRFWSAGCERLYGWTSEQAVGRISHDLLHAVFPAPLRDIGATLLREGEWSGDVIHRRRDGTVITVAVRKVLRRVADGRPAAVMESLTDVTRLRRVEEDLRWLNAELGERVREEVAAREAAHARLAHAQRMEALGRLAGGVAHDFNNVMQTVQGAANLIRRHSDERAAVDRFSGMIEEAAERGLSVTRRLLAFARQGELQAAPVDVSSLFDSVQEVLEHTRETGVSIKLDIAPGLLPVLADRSQLEMALINLATNALDAMPQGGTLTLSATRKTVSEGGQPEVLAPGTYIRIAVADTGTGMDAEMLARVMEPFFTTKPRGKGTGLGLPMARGFVEQSGGALTLASDPGRGTTVTIWLPAASTGVAASLPAKEPTTPAPSRPGRILLVDDDDPVREVVAAQLADHGFEVVEAPNGAAALELLDKGEPIDLMVSDFAMPGMDGMALIRKAQERRRHLPAILLTGYSEEAASLAHSTAGSETYSVLRKPVSGTQLAAHIAKLLEARTRPSHDPGRFRSRSEES